MTYRRPIYIPDKPTTRQLGAALREGAPFGRLKTDRVCQLCRGADKECGWCGGSGVIEVPREDP